MKLTTSAQIVPCRRQGPTYLGEGRKLWTSRTGFQHLIVFDANPDFFGHPFLRKTSLLPNPHQVLTACFEGLCSIGHPTRISTLFRREHQRVVGNRLTLIPRMVWTSLRHALVNMTKLSRTNLFAHGKRLNRYSKRNPQRDTFLDKQARIV